MTVRRIFVNLLCGFVILWRLSFSTAAGVGFAEVNSQLCCQIHSNSREMRCWNQSAEDNKQGNTSALFGCLRNNSESCYNVTRMETCKNDSGLSIVQPDKANLHIGAFVPFKQSDKYGHYTAMKMAIDIVNNRTDILADYKLVLDAEDTVWVSQQPLSLSALSLPHSLVASVFYFGNNLGAVGAF